MRYLIIGNSVAGVHCVEAIRGVDKEGPITICSDEETLNYSRPLLSYYLGGRIAEDRLAFRDEAFYQRHSVDLILEKKATGLDTKKRRVSLADGTRLPYDRLLLSVGGVPIVPPIDGLRHDTTGVFTFIQLQETKRLINYIEQESIQEAVVLGAGLIGLKAIEGLIERGVRVTVIELVDRVLANTFDTEASSILEARLAAHGCTVIKRDTIQQIKTKGKKVRQLVLKSGTEISTSLLIVAVGVRPNLALVKGTTIRTDRGIVVDEYMRTSAEDVYAAGDCAQGLDFLSKENVVIAIWPVAARQGKIAGLNMSGFQTPYPGLFAMNSVQIMDIPTISFGMTTPPDGKGYEVLHRVDRTRSLYKKIILKDNRVVGAILLNAIERAGVYGMLIREGIDVKGFKDQLLNDDFGLLVLPKEFRKHLVAGESFVA
ncbi:MAG: NAD(P)/FAD-dependent oxidoreductase [Deltaproteobacteria bacterium]|nr:NAD(P)/FAD-dependent oxidoreductase [Deltaproteobacteria bacterium]